jgi:hypothetical protein
MRILRQPLAAFVWCILLGFCLSGNLAIQGRLEGGAQKKSLSRTAWILQHMRETRFSRGLLSALNQPRTNPAMGEAASGITSGLAALRAAATGTTPPVQVSQDLLPVDPAAEQATHVEPYLAMNPSNPANLVGAWQENRFEDAGASALSYGVSFDGGLGWTTHLAPHITKSDGGVWERASDPWVAFGADSRVYLSGLLFNETTFDSAVGVSRSVDGGMTWSDPVTVFSSNHPDLNDKDAIAVDTFPSSPFFGNIYVAWDLNVAPPQGTRGRVKQHVLVARSIDGGATYQEPVTVQRKGVVNLGAVPQVGPDGTVYVVWMSNRGSDCSGTLTISRSDDGGQNWTRPRPFAPDCAAGVNGLRTGDELPSFAVDPATGYLYVAWQSGKFAPTGQAALVVSTDRGNTWSEPIRVSDAPDDASVFTVSVATAGNQTVALSYYSLQNDPDRKFLADEYVRVSSDGGKTFRPGLRATPQSFDLRLAAHSLVSAPFLGDYQGLAGANGSLHLLWVNPGIMSAVTGQLQPEVLTSSTQ